MKPEIVDRPRLLLAGVVNCGGDITDIDIRGLWDVYARAEPGIQHRMDGSWYELHVGSTLGHGIYSVTAGAEVAEAGALPVEVSLRVVPAGAYAHFVHRMKDGGFGEAFSGIEAWVNQTGTKVKDFGLQHFDRDFDPEDKDSVLHIYIPLG